VPCRSVDCKETKTCRKNSIKFEIAVGQKLIALVGCGVQGDRIVYLVVDGKGVPHRSALYHSCVCMLSECYRNRSGRFQYRHQDD